MHANYYGLALVMALIGSCAAHGQSIYFGEDVNHTATGGNEDATRIPHPNADAAHANFLAHLQGVQTESFETYAPNSTVTSLSFGPDTATLTPGLTVLNIPTGTFNGVYPISGNQTLLQNIGNPNTFRIDFSSPQAAFGFYSTDIEVPGNLSLRFLLTDGITTIDRPVPTLAGAAGANNTGSVMYYGVIDTLTPFIAVSFIRNLNSGDGFGFDDITIGRVSNVPEPGVIAALAFLAIPWPRRRGRK